MLALDQAENDTAPMTALAVRPFGRNVSHKHGIGFLELREFVTLALEDIHGVLNGAVLVIRAKCVCPRLYQLEHFILDILMRSARNQGRVHLTAGLVGDLLMHWLAAIFYNTL